MLSGAYWLIHNSFIEKRPYFSEGENIIQDGGCVLLPRCHAAGERDGSLASDPRKDSNRAGRGTRGGAAYGRPTCLPTSTSVGIPPTLMVVWPLLQESEGFRKKHCSEHLCVQDLLSVPVYIRRCEEAKVRHVVTAGRVCLPPASPLTHILPGC